MATPAEQLEHELVTRADQVMVVAGIGVSMATCGNHPNASWKGLLQHGLQRCEETCGTAKGVLDGYRRILNDRGAALHDLINVGQFITEELKSKREGSFSAWLCDSIGGIKLRDAALVRVLATLDVKLATTNYDNMIEDGTGRSPITWQDPALAAAFFREPTQDVLHLHGHYRRPESVILGASSYDRICRDDFAQAALRSLMISGTLVFVGCGAGLEDPNFKVLLEWARTTLAMCHHSHFILVRSADVDDWRKQLQGIPIDPIPYGAEHHDLTPFLKDLAQRVHQQRVSEPLSLLYTSQMDFNARWEELERNPEELPPLEYIRRSKILATQLWRAGGRRRAALAFSSRLTAEGQSLLTAEYVEFALDAAERLLDEDLPSLASNHLGELKERLGQIDIPTQQLRRFQHLRIRCMDALCAYVESLRAIEEALAHAGDDERARLEAERSEIHFLQGNFTQAVAESE